MIAVWIVVLLFGGVIAAAGVIGDITMSRRAAWRHRYFEPGGQQLDQMERYRRRSP